MQQNITVPSSNSDPSQVAKFAPIWPILPAMLLCRCCMANTEWMYLIIDGEEQFDRVNSGPLAGIPTQNPVFFENSHELIDRNGFERAT